MSMSDPIADMLTRVRNAVAVGHKQVVLPTSKIKENVASILRREGFIKDYRIINEEGTIQKILKINLLYREGKEPAITGLKRVSKPGLRIYVGKHEVPRFYYGLGISIISTPQGLMTGQESWRAGIGGEVICYVW
jgi:small subunit ribosomal protein S8